MPLQGGHAIRQPALPEVKMPARKKATTVAPNAKPMKTARTKPQAIVAVEDSAIPGLTKEVSTLVTALMAKDADILEALREA